MGCVIGTAGCPALGPGAVGRIVIVSWLFAALLAVALAVLVTAEWPRLVKLFPRGAEARPRRRRKTTHLHVVRTEQDEFAASVQRDLDRLPTIEEHERR
jgi:hypothetical protein